MRYAAIFIAMALAGCSTTGPPPEPIPGSLTYGRVARSPYPPGTVINNTFLGKWGYRRFEQYVVQPDGTLKLTFQQTAPDFLVW
ncbi:hypothetical protein ATY81_10785 [Rhizobium sp. R72]|uniref:hypothetical protein n=1 Tax=unclassified Rhizobium TaxID=2613769 RepID=UPI000B64E320|nr:MULTISPECIES: hypothetical protein [unclassified Rhizobium]OWV86929.1 hypothetical protein ATY79_08995 [Rhizobium sp. R693]OWV95635.1 hypothetical protein ATY81_10785 [Rhizobium sp. R72]OWV95935.1 hypothetical protein ATY80_10785 [Rhizobium sp. R711]